MKKLLLMALAMTCLWTTTHAQVGINTTTPDATLDVVGTDSGVLIPRVALTATNVAAPITTPTTSELIYNTASAGTGVNAVTPGYYYWNGTIWVRLNAGTDATTNWSLTGNSGIDPATNFIGTVTNDPLAFRTNNEERMRILSSNGYVGIGLGEQDPTQQLHIAGNLRVDGAFMPNNQAGAENQILLSKGVANPPVWGPGLLNVEQIENFGKWYAGPFNLNNNTYFTLTITDPNMTGGSTVSANIVGPLPLVAGLEWGYNITLFAEPRNGEVRFHMRNDSIYNISNLQIAYFAIYAPN